MKRIKWGIWICALLIIFLVGSASALPTYLASFNTQYGTSSTVLNTCNLCHVGGNTAVLNSYASAFAAAGHNFAAIENLDSDGDGFTNIQEINARTFPGDATSFPVPPVVTVFNIPATSASLNVPISAFTATDNVGVTGYMVTESSVAPSAGAVGWTVTPPASYTFTTQGSKTLFAWAKNAVPLVSQSRSATVVVTLPIQPDTTPPTVTAFTIPATSSSLTVPITSFTATDNVGVTGYMVSEAATTPAAAAAGWTATAPVSYTFTSAGSKTLYAWAKDAAGNVSASLSATVAITLPVQPDTTPPVITAFTIPATSSSLTVPITFFTATDNVGVTGYMVSETTAAPAPTATGWTAVPPASYTFASTGSKILYAWAKDAAGNISASKNASVTIVALAGPVNLSPAAGSTNVSLTPTLQISTVFPDPNGNTQKSTNWQIAGDVSFSAASIVFSSMADVSHLTSLVVPPGALLPGRTYYFRAATINSALQTSPYSSATAFTTQTVTMDTATGTTPDALTVKSGGTQVTNLAALTPAALAAAGNISAQLVSGANSVPAVNAGTGTDVTKPGMMIVMANGGTGRDVLGIVTPAGSMIQNVTTTTTSDNAFAGATLPAGITFAYGVVSFRIGGVIPGSSINITVYTPTDLPSGAIWCKYSPVNGWMKIDSSGIYDVSGNFLSADARFSVVGGRGVLTIKDNGIADFSTEVVGGNGVILDPGGPGIPSTATSGPAPGSSGGCFIATAAFGSPINAYVKVLKEFRDTFLLTNSIGRQFVNAYYRISPAIAEQIEANPLLRFMMRIILLPIIGFSLIALRIDMAAALGTAVLLLMMAGFAGRWFYKRGKRPSIN
ncbi:MAG: hypothetical protein CSYNP_02291 [Syntrophus sp. SKADARSKE-3]|nr:hypothetical protein [Syntrophus sp. SKADARSKE-3]